MKKRFIENGIEYVRNGDYYIPNLTVPDDMVYNIGKYGRLHAKFIKKNRPCFYTAKMLDGTWLAYLEEIDISAKEMVDRLIKELADKRGIAEKLKVKGQMTWVGIMNNIRHSAEEFALKNIVYSMDVRSELYKNFFMET